MTSVSVVIPCYTYGHFLDEAVSSIQDDQVRVDVQGHIIDDAPPMPDPLVVAPLPAVPIGKLLT
jgi:hypothetical protein